MTAGWEEGLGDTGIGPEVGEAAVRSGVKGGSERE